MNTPYAPEGVFEGALLFDGCDYRTPEGIVDYRFSGDRLGLIVKKQNFYRAEYLTKRPSITFSMPVWDEALDRTICGSESEARKLVEKFVNQENEN